MHQRILDGLNEGKNQNIRQLEEQIQAEKAIESYLEARHEAFEIIKVQKLKHDEEKNFIFPSSFFSFFNLFPSLSSPLLSFFFLSPFLAHLGE